MDRLRGRLMAQSLSQLLDRVRGAREVLPHLAALERGLLEAGPLVIDRVPAPGLARLCSQLGSLPLPVDDAPLHELLTRLMDALQARTAAPAPRAPGPAPAVRLAMIERDDLPFDIKRTAVIEEATHSEFMRAGGASTGR